MSHALDMRVLRIYAGNLRFEELHYRRLLGFRRPEEAARALQQATHLQALVDRTLQTMMERKATR